LNNDCLNYIGPKGLGYSGLAIDWISRRLVRL